MSEDLEALLRREIEAVAFSPGLDLDVGYATLDALAARLAEVVRPMFENLTVEAVLLAKRERVALRNFARLLWAYYDAQWAGTREHGEMLDEGRKLGVVDGPSEAQEDEREGQMLAEQWSEHEQQTRP